MSQICINNNALSVSKGRVGMFHSYEQEKNEVTGQRGNAKEMVRKW